VSEVAIADHSGLTGQMRHRTAHPPAQQVPEHRSTEDRDQRTRDHPDEEQVGQRGQPVPSFLPALPQVTDVGVVGRSESVERPPAGVHLGH
jgi:hypothetical protein